MKSIEHCIKEAERCERIATQLSNPALRLTFCDIAAMWRNLAHSSSDRSRGMLDIMDIGDTKPRH